ncbi:hypothetical protein ACWGJW_02455 [Streptomyces nigrescens]
MTVWFQDGTTYTGADMQRYNACLFGDTGGCHLFQAAGDFNVTSDQVARTLTVSAGQVLVYSGGGYRLADKSTSTTLSVSAPSSLNPRVDLVVARLDASNNVIVEILDGTPAASPVSVNRPANSVGLAAITVPKATTTFTVTQARFTGQYADQLLSPSPGHFASKWPSGTLPNPSGFRTGATIHDLTNNQRWTKRDSGAWWTTDMGPWRTVTLKNFDADGTAITTTGTLYARESSEAWEFSGQATFSPGIDFTTLNRFANVPSSIAFPTQNTYGGSGQTFGAGATSGLVRFGFMTTGELEIQSDGVISNLYTNVRLAKSPWNT